MRVEERLLKYTLTGQLLTRNADRFHLRKDSLS